MTRFLQVREAAAPSVAVKILYKQAGALITITLVARVKASPVVAVHAAYCATCVTECWVVLLTILRDFVRLLHIWSLDERQYQWDVADTSNIS